MRKRYVLADGRRSKMRAPSGSGSALKDGATSFLSGGCTSRDQFIGPWLRVCTIKTVPYAFRYTTGCTVHAGLPTVPWTSVPPTCYPFFHLSLSVRASLSIPLFVSLSSSLSFSLFLRLPLSFWILQKLSSYQRSRITSRVALVAMISNVGGT